MHTLQLFIHLVEQHRYWGYAALFLLMLVEGELILAGTGMLISLKAFHPFDAFFFAFAGVLFSDLMWYLLGKHLLHHHSHRPFITHAITKVRKFLPGIEKNPAHIIFLSKFIYGLNHSTILVLGYLNTEFKQFFRVQFFTSLLWCVIFLAVGYFFGSAAISFAHSLDRFILIVISTFIFLLVAEHLIRKYIIKTEQEK